MAQIILSNSSSNLNVSHSKTVWLHQTIKAGNNMAAFLCQTSVLAGEGSILAEKWYQLMDELEAML